MKRIEYVSTIHARSHMFAALFAVVIALATFANGDAMSSAHSHKAKKGSLKVTSPIEVGGATLQPGDYEVKEVNSASGATVEFVHLFDNLFAAEGLPVHEQEVVAQVKSTVQPLSSAPKKTALRFAPNTSNAIALEIRGSTVDYLFASPELTGEAVPTVAGTNSGSHE